MIPGRNGTNKICPRENQLRRINDLSGRIGEVNVNEKGENKGREKSLEDGTTIRLHEVNDYSDERSKERFTEM